MSNMSYCRFRNTLADLRDCRENLAEAIGPGEEAEARISLVLECVRILEMVGLETSIESTQKEFAAIVREALRDTLDEENDAEKIARETPPPAEPKATAEPFEVGKKPDVDLSNCDGNAFAILGRCAKTARRAGKSEAWVDRFMTEAKSGNYDHLLQTAFRFFEVS
ncbi:MAG: hypothetical protein M0R66_09760 [Candidatus Omnitrophica bacterium]|nr:hypothetical protein [Candidatus Omnitrophota bacterium]